MIGRSLIRKVAAPVSHVADIASAFLMRYRNRHLKHAFSIRSHMTTPERVVLSRLAEGRGIICEIGSYIGASACCFGAGLNRADAGTILCIDTWNNDAMSEGNWDTYAEFSRNIAPYAEFIVPIRGLSTEVVNQVANRVPHIDLLFIDGDHSYDGVTADWEAYKRFLKHGSLVVFHDCGWAEGVQRVIEEDAKPRMSSYDKLPNARRQLF